MYHGVRAALVLALAGVTYVFFPAAPAVESPLFEAGAVATRRVVAPFEFIVRKTDAELAREREELARSAKPIFAYASAALDSSQQELSAFMTAIGAASDETRPSRQAAIAIQREALARGVSVTPQEAEYLNFPGRRRALHASVRAAFNRWLTAGVVASTPIDDLRGAVIVRRGGVERSVLADSILSFGTLLARARAEHPDPNSSVGDALYIKLLNAFFHPTIVPDRAATEGRRDELRASVDSVRFHVRAHEKIVGENEVVGRAEFDKMRALNEAMQQRLRGQRSLGRIVGTVAYNALVLAMLGIAIFLFRPHLYRSMRALVLVVGVVLVVLAGAAFTARAQQSYPELIPVAFAAVMLSILYDSRISMIAAMILAVLVGGQGAYRGTNALFLSLVAGAAAALSVRVVRNRSQAYFSIAVTAAAYFAAVAAIGLTLGHSAGAIGRSAVLGSANAVMSVMAAMFLLPLAERFTGVTTDLTLLEFSDLNRPLLRRLMLEAPGTYEHTVKMATLAEAACNAIGANGLLARVGTYYHDIGKLKRPHFFVENQQRGSNPHDELRPGTSATIIRRHVDEGLELAEAHRLPPALKAFISQHHGTGPISFFLEKAKESDGAPDPAEFAYPGPVPQTAETAICMLADGIEASVRVLQEPTPERVREVIDHIVRQRIEQGQLREAPLTLKQLEVVKEAFARVLVAGFHSRIDYPAASGGVTSEFASV